MKVNIVNISNNKLPEYSTPHSSGMDLRANLIEPVLLKPHERILVKTGLFIEIPSGYEGDSIVTISLTINQSDTSYTNTNSH